LSLSSSMYQTVIKSFILRASGMKFAVPVRHGKVSSLGGGGGGDAVILQRVTNMTGTTFPQHRELYKKFS
jgi:hypothetical protein